MESFKVAVESVWAWPPFEWGWDVVQHIPWSNLLDIGIMTFIVYQAYLRFRGTRAIRVLEGVAILGFGGLLAQKAGLFLTSWLLGAISAAAVIFLIVIFQAEIRQILERVNPRLPVLLRRIPQEELAVIAETAFMLASKRCGALFVFERQDPLEPLLRSAGTLVDAQASQELLETMFTPPTPLHDGAVYVREGRLYRAGCVLPLSANPTLASFYGTRHRAALGITEQSDALVIVVSEERGAVSVAERGTLEVVQTPTLLLAWLNDRLRAPGEQQKRQWFSMSGLTHNWQPKLAALAIVGLLWFVLVGRQDTEVGFSIPVVYTNIPRNLVILEQGIQDVYVRVRGSEEMLNFLDPSRLRAAIDLKDAKAGSQRYAIAAKDINLPPGLQLIGVEPEKLRLRLRETPVESNGTQTP
jgi:diadenylate cyclase